MRLSHPDEFERFVLFAADPVCNGGSTASADEAPSLYRFLYSAGVSPWVPYFHIPRFARLIHTQRSAIHVCGGKDYPLCFLLYAKELL